MAKAAKLTIVEAENIVEVGEIDPNDVHLPGIFVDRIVPATVDKHIEVLKLRKDEGEQANGKNQTKDAAQEKRDRIGRRAAEELRDGYYVNLGVGEFSRSLALGGPMSEDHYLTSGRPGIPTLAVSFLPPQRKVWIQSENGILGMGPYPTKGQVDA